MVDVSAKAHRAPRPRRGPHPHERRGLRRRARCPIAKGDVLGTARIAGMMAAKRTAELIPLCHPLALSDVQVRFTFERRAPPCAARPRCAPRRPTGVEMEALTAVVGGAPHHLRHGEERRQGDADRGGAAAREGRRQVRGVAREDAPPR